MNASGKKILYFLHENYDFMLQLFNSSKLHHFSIKTDLLIEYCQEYHVDLKKLEEFKIVREHNNSEYSIYLKYRDFFEFLLDDFKPVLDESIRIYKQLINDYFLELKESVHHNDHNKVNELINALVDEIDRFSVRVEDNTKQLLTETRQLKANENQADYLDKVIKANYWIENYIKPLNDVLDKAHEDSVRHEIDRISNYASRQRFEYPAYEIRQQFDLLYHRMASNISDILKNSAIISKDLMPLIERIKSENLVLSGAIALIENFRKGKEIKVLNLFNDTKRSRPYSENFREEVKFLLEKEAEPKAFFLNPVNEEDINLWCFDLETRNQFKQRFIKSLPIENFFLWCFTHLKSVTDQLYTENYFALTSLLFIDSEIEREFNIAIQTQFLSERVEIELINGILDLPKVQIKPLKNGI